MLKVGIHKSKISYMYVSVQVTNSLSITRDNCGDNMMTSLVVHMMTSLVVHMLVLSTSVFHNKVTVKCLRKI